MIIDLDILQRIYVMIVTLAILFSIFSSSLSRLRDRPHLRSGQILWLKIFEICNANDSKPPQAMEFEPTIGYVIALSGCSISPLIGDFGLRANL